MENQTNKSYPYRKYIVSLCYNLISIYKDMYKKVIAFLLLILMSCSAFSAGTGTQKQSKQSQENVVAQMNYCINSLTNIIHNKSIVVLDHESDQIINNLTMEQIVGFLSICTRIVGFFIVRICKDFKIRSIHRQ